MFYDSELQFVRKTFEKCRVQTHIIDPTTPLKNYAGQGLYHIFGVAVSEKTFYDCIGDCRPATIYRLTDMLYCRYIFVQLPHSEPTSVLVVGPYITNNITHQQVLEQSERLSLPMAMTQELELFYGAVPVIREENHLFAVLNTFAEFVFHGENNFDNVDLHFENHFAFPYGNLGLKPGSDNESLDIQVMESRYQFENELMQAVSQGNTHKAELMLASFSDVSFESRTADQLRNFKNYCIIMNTLMRKAAEKGQVHPVHLDKVSSEFAHRIEAMRSIANAKEFMTEVIQAYCRLVKRHSMKNFSPLVQKTMILVENDLTGDLSLQNLANKNNVSAGYLSGVFKKETGTTITKYVNSRRIALAKHLLKTSHLQIQTIAQHCGILDFHYFCRLFKNSVGKTPTEYRNGYHIE